MLKQREKEGRPFDESMFTSMFKGKLIFPYEEVTDLDWLFGKRSELMPIECFQKNKMNNKKITKDAYENMVSIFNYFGCKSNSDLLHLYTLEDGILLAIILSNTFEMVQKEMQLDPTNYVSTAKFSYTACKRSMNTVMQTIPNGRLYDCICRMKRAGFSMIKKNITLASPLQKHVQECHYNPNCPTCSPFVYNVENDKDYQKLKEEVFATITGCKEAQSRHLEEISQDEYREWESTDAAKFAKMTDHVSQIEEIYERARTSAFRLPDKQTKEGEELETIAVLQSSIVYMDENNQYGNALKNILPIGNFTFVTCYADGTPLDQAFIEHLLQQQDNNLKRNRKARVLDFFACVDIELPENCSPEQLQRAEEFNLLVRNRIPKVTNFTEKMLRNKRLEYKNKEGKYTSLSLNKKLMCGTEKLKSYFCHSAMLNSALLDGWKITKVHNLVAFGAQRICEDYIQMNQDFRLFYTKKGMKFLGNFFKLMNNGVYGWMCRSPERYLETTLLMSEIDSYNYFEKQMRDMCTSDVSLQEQAVLISMNPHDNNLQKKEKVANLYEKYIDIGSARVREKQDMIASTKNESRKQKLYLELDKLYKYTLELQVAKLEAIANFENTADLFAAEEERKKAECEAKGKKYWEVPKSRQPRNKDVMKSKEEVVHQAMSRANNENTYVCLFDDKNGTARNVCFGFVSAPRKKVILTSKNDVAVVVLSHAKARISEFARYLNKALADHFRGVSVKLIMTDTDSCAYQIRYVTFLKRIKTSKKLVFASKEDADAVLNLSLGSNQLKRDIESILCGSVIMRRMVDRAHYEKHQPYFDDSRLKKVGLYTDEVPLPHMVVSFQACGPKNYQYIRTGINKDTEKEELVNMCRHKGISNKLNVSEENYSDLIRQWDQQFDRARVVMGYDPHNRDAGQMFTTVQKKKVPVPSAHGLKRQALMDKGEVVSEYEDDVTPFTRSDGKTVAEGKTKKFRRKRPKSKLLTRNVTKIVGITDIVPKLFSSRSFFTNQAGVFRTRMDKVLGATPSDKMLFPRHDFGAYCPGSRFCCKVTEFNESVSYDEMFSNEHLAKLCALENEFLDYEMERYYPNGVRSQHILSLEERLDHQTCVEYLLRKEKANEERKKVWLSKDSSTSLDVVYETDRLDAEDDYLQSVPAYQADFLENN